MTFPKTFRRLCCGGVFIAAAFSARGQSPDIGTLDKKIGQLAADGDYAAISNLIDAQEETWKLAPSVSYFLNVAEIADVLTGLSDPRLYWLGRKAAWNMLLKPAPREYGAAQPVRTSKEILLFGAIEAGRPYLINVNLEMYSAARHDTFLMLTEYARQVHATLIPGYRNKFSGAANDIVERKRLMQNAVDNQEQDKVRGAIFWLSENQVDYLVEAYKHLPRDDHELRQLLDNLNIQGSTRETIIRQVTGGKGFGETTH